jgi:hypothetical protein
MTNSRKPTNAETLEGQLAVSEDGRRHINLNRGEREALARQRQIEAAAALFLDLETDRTWAEIASELDMSVSSLKRLTQSSDFILVYEDALATIGHDPRLQAVTSSLGDLLPAARRRLQKLITENDTPDGVALKAIERLFQWTGADNKIETDNPEALKNFLQQNNVTVEGNMTVINIPEQYQNAFQHFLGGDTDIVSGEVHTLDNGESEHEPDHDPQAQDPSVEPPVEEAQPEP